LNELLQTIGSQQPDVKSGTAGEFQPLTAVSVCAFVHMFTIILIDENASYSFVVNLCRSLCEYGVLSLTFVLGFFSVSVHFID